MEFKSTTTSQSLGLLSTHPYNIRIRVFTLVYTLYKPNWDALFDRTQKAYTATVRSSGNIDLAAVKRSLSSPTVLNVLKHVEQSSD